MAHPRIEIANLAHVPAKATAALNAKGYRRLADLAGMSEKDIASIAGVGPKTAAYLVSEVRVMST